MTEFGRVYGEGLYSLCVDEKMDESALEELRAVKAAFRQNPDFARLLSNMSISKAERVEILDRTLKGQVHPYLLNFLKLLVERGAIGSLDDCERAYTERYNLDHQVTEAEVTTARPLDDAQKQRLLSRLREMTGRNIVLREKVDPDLLGGVLLQMDGKRYDNTVRQRLKAIEQAMVGDS